MLSIIIVCLYYTAMSVPCSLAITCWERADLLALLCMMFPCVLGTFLYGVLGHVWYLIVSILDRCLLLDFDCFLVIMHCISWGPPREINRTEQNRTKLLFAVKLRPHAGGI